MSLRKMKTPTATEISTWVAICDGNRPNWSNIPKNKEGNPSKRGGKTTYFAGVCDLPRSAVKNTLRANIYYKFCK